MVDIYDWPASLVPMSQLFRTPGQAKAGGFTVKGAAVLFPEPGGRAALDQTFNAQMSASAERLFSWVMTKAANGTVFRVPIVAGGQTVDLPDLGVDDAETGNPWSNNMPWSNGQNWEADPGVIAYAAGAEGDLSIRVDFGTIPQVLMHGHVIGHKDRAYVVDDISWDGTVAEITLSMPLRVDVVSGDFITFRPRMMGICQDAERLMAMFDVSRIIRPGSITFVEALI